MKNKLYPIFFAMLLFLTSMAYAVEYYEQIEIVKGEISPLAVEPGKNMTLGISVWNRYETPKQLSVKLVEEFPFVLMSSEKNLEENFLLCAGCKTTNNYYLTIDHTAVSGIYKLQFIANDEKNELKDEIDVEVKGISDIVLEVVNINEDITPNSEFEVLLNINNKGTGVARDIKITSDSNQFLLKGTDIISAGEVQAGESEQLKLTFLVGSSVIKDIYAVPLNMEYKDHDGNLHEVTQKLSIRIVNKAKLGIKEVKIEPAKINPGDEITIQVRIENIGDGDADNIMLLLESKIEGNKETYLGRLEKDDDSPAFFSGKIMSSGEKTDTLVITYNDDLGEHEIREQIGYTVRGMSVAGIVIIVLVIIILALAGLLFFFWFFKACKCYIKGKKCPGLKEHVKGSIDSAVKLFKPKNNESEKK